MRPDMVHTLTLQHDVPPSGPPLLQYEPGPSGNETVWYWLRFALIAWASLGIARTLPDVSRHVHGPRLVETLIQVAGLAFTLAGAMAARDVRSPNASRAIGAWLLVLHLAFAMLLGSLVTRTPAKLFLAVQQVLLPILPLLVRRDLAAQGEGDGPVLGHPLPLLLAAQIPAAIGIVWVGAILLGVMDAGFWGFYFVAALASSVAGSVLSLILSLCFGNTAYAEAGKKLAALHAMYLAALILCVVIGIAGHEVRPGG